MYVEPHQIIIIALLLLALFFFMVGLLSSPSKDTNAEANPIEFHIQCYSGGIKILDSITTKNFVSYQTSSMNSFEWYEKGSGEYRAFVGADCVVSSNKKE